MWASDHKTLIKDSEDKSMNPAMEGKILTGPGEGTSVLSVVNMRQCLNGLSSNAVRYTLFPPIYSGESDSEVLRSYS